jgi:hypothetical protein
MFANPDGCNEKMGVGIETIGLHNDKKIFEKEFKKDVLRFAKYLTSNPNKSNISTLFVKFQITLPLARLTGNLLQTMGSHE